MGLRAELIVAALAFLLAGLCPARADQTAARVCAGDTQALAQFQGVYVNPVFLDALRRTLSVPEAYAAESKAGAGLPTAIIVGPDGIVQSFAWHQVVPLDCVEIKGKTLVLKSVPFVWLGSRTDSGDHLGVVFKGCFADQLGSKWCFSPGAVEIDGKVRQAELVLDMSEMWPETALRVDGTSGLESKFWFFRKTDAGGWLVIPGGWASHGSPKPDWDKPWRTLVPVAPGTR
jgi:hypothetical protein